MKKQPEYLCMNPVFNILQKDIMTMNEYKMYTDIWGEIRHVVVKAPMKVYLPTKNIDITDIKNYPLESFIPPISNDI